MHNGVDHGLLLELLSLLCALETEAEDANAVIAICRLQSTHTHIHTHYAMEQFSECMYVNWPCNQIWCCE